jgi:hypothetical protein
MDGAIDQTLFHVIKESNQASLGGNIVLTSTSVFVGYRDADGAIYYYLTIDKNGNGGFSGGVTFHTPSSSIQEIDAGGALNWANGADFQRRNGGAVSVAGDPGKGVVNYTTTAVSSAATVAGAPFSAEIITAQLTNHVFESGRAYEIQVLGGFNPSSNTTAGNFKIRAGTTVAGTVWWDYLWTDAITGAGGGVSPAVAEPGYVRRAVGTNLTSSFVCCLQTNNAGTGTHFANGVGIQRAMIIRDVGKFADFPWATSI